MTEKRKNIVTVCLFAVAILGLSIGCWLKTPDAYSDSERRALQTFPELTWSTVMSGDFMTEFELYTQDQFPARDQFRTVKSICAFYAFSRLDNNDIFIKDGHISKLDYVQNDPMLDHAAELFDYIYNTYLSSSDADVYLSIVPDKNYFLNQNSIYLSLDYDRFVSDMRQRVDYMTYIDITDTLSIDDYYRTDSHWRQERLIDTARDLASAMGTELTAEYDVNTLDNPFYGVYSGQSALPLSPDQIRYLTNDTLDSCIVTSYDTGKPVPKPMYDMEKAHGKDPYEMFLCGSDALLTIENPNAASDKEIIIFRDSYASSLTPLLAEGYSKITLIDIRYVRSDMLGNLVDFSGHDVLFIYSSTILNNSLALK